MNTSNLNQLCHEILTLIEIEEVKLLSWGFVELHTDLRRLLPEMLEGLSGSVLALWEEAQEAGITEEDVLENLIERRLLFEVSQGGYRSRFAEAVRLLFLLRQRFSDEDWQAAARLVSDMRLHLQRRRYPRREVAVDQLLAELSALHISPLQEEAIRLLLTGADGTPFELAQFQVEAMVQQFRDLRAFETRALVIGAGTGAGKTKAFYVPALAHIAASLTANKHTVKVLAIYPRTELLKDQLAEAFAEARKLDQLLLSEGKRAITIGAYYGDTPKSAADFSSSFKPANWKYSDEQMGWQCPFFSCPEGCGEALIWDEFDLEEEQAANKKGEFGPFAKLRCPSCEVEVSAEQLLLTREQMIRHPPDILFTTTEMLNRRLSRAREHALFGIGTSTPPRLVLLDEIHSYEGVTGAQVAYLLRRWRYARGERRSHNLCLVGLSATLMQAESFFATLTGVPDYRVSYIFPRDEQLIEEGIEYNIVLKGDPVSGTSLLSTSVQTAMLLGRILDNGDNPISEGAYGHKTFAFTDKLDVINRWYHIQHDAEWIKTLSQWRANNHLDAEIRARRNQMGQIWRVCEFIGHDLGTPLRLGRTTSQDRGVDRNAELIIATSTLEVGFNDPAVGAIIQHKAPHSMASFLQRKGRAGRKRGMRPWMVVVTSDYGRDRWAFQHAEMLFNPYLSPLELPIENYYIRKIQAAYVLMDWLSLTLKRQHLRIDVWKTLSSDKWSRSKRLDQQRSLICRLLRQVLEGQGTGFDSFLNYLTSALSLRRDDRAAQVSILWGEPRSLLFEVIPTLLRQLETNWQVIEHGQPRTWGDTTADQPMPDFVPSALFTDLNLPEVMIRLPRAEQEEEEEEEEENKEQFLSLTLALNEFVPGRANKRFVQEYKKDVAHWLALPNISQLENGRLPITRLNIRVDPLAQPVEICHPERSERSGATTYNVYRPRLYTLDVVPPSVRSTSYAQFIWQSTFEPQSQLNASGAPSDIASTPLVLPPESKWHRFFSQACAEGRSITAFTQENGTWVNVTRLATGVRVNTRYQNGQEQRAILNFVDAHDQPAAIGFQLAVDALQFTFELLDAEKLMQAPDWSQLYHNLGPQYFLHKLLTNERLTADLLLSRFEIEWLWQLELSMLVKVAIAQSLTLQEAATVVQRHRETLADETLRIIFQSQQAYAEARLGPSPQDGRDEEQAGRLHEKLMEYIQSPVVQEVLNDACTVLWQPQRAELADWLADCYASSLGATLFTALTRLVPDIEPDDLLLDIFESSIWISEVTPAGVGLISKIADAISQRPRAFELQLLDTLEYCEREQLALQLKAITDLVGAGNQSLQQAFDQARHETDLRHLTETKALLTDTLETNGIPATRQLAIALNSKFLRPNSDQDSDQLITTLVQEWSAQENRLGCAIDLRVMSVAAHEIPAVQQQVTQLLERIGEQQAALDNTQIANLLQSLLWLNCVDSCPNCIQTWQPYQPLTHPSRALLRTLLTLNNQIITVGTPDWQTHLTQTLSTHHQLQLHCPQTQLTTCKQALLTLLTTPIEIGYQLFYPIVERIQRQQREWIIHLAIRELVGD